MAIKVYLDEQLRARGITAKELCARVGITEANLSILRSGKAKGVRFHTINRICYYLQCDVGDILKFDGEQVPKILETPYIKAEDSKKSYPPYKYEIEMLKQEQFDPQMKEKILEDNQK